MVIVFDYVEESPSKINEVSTFKDAIDRLNNDEQLEHFPIGATIIPMPLFCKSIYMNALAGKAFPVFIKDANGWQLLKAEENKAGSQAKQESKYPVGTVVKDVLSTNTTQNNVYTKTPNGLWDNVYTIKDSEIGEGKRYRVIIDGAVGKPTSREWHENMRQANIDDLNSRIKSQAGQINTNPIPQPKKEWITGRIDILKQYMGTCANQSLCIPIYFVTEYNSLVEQLKNLKD